MFTFTSHPVPPIWSCKKPSTRVRWSVCLEFPGSLANSRTHVLTFGWETLDLLVTTVKRFWVLDGFGRGLRASVFQVPQKSHPPTSC